MTQSRPSTRQIAAHLDLTHGRISQLHSDGILPVGGSLDECRVAYIRWLRSRAPKGGGSPDLNAERARLAAAQAGKTELDLAERRGELLDVDVVASLWARLVTEAKTRVLSLPNKIAPRLIGCTRESARALLEMELHAALRGISESAGYVGAGMAAVSESDGEPMGRHESDPESRGERGAGALEH
jgi:phage terminase Nu1 subunit (DNA packaging protein)